MMTLIVTRLEDGGRDETSQADSSTAIDPVDKYMKLNYNPNSGNSLGDITGL